MHLKKLTIVDPAAAVHHAALLDRVNGLDLSHVYDALVERDEMLAGDAAEAVDAYRAWRLLQAMHPERTVLITEAGDQAWHWDVLHTQRYAEGCAAVEGYFVHHSPGVSKEVVAAEWPATVALFRTVLGIELVAADVGNCVRGDEPANCVRGPAVANCVRPPTAKAA